MGRGIWKKEEENRNVHFLKVPEGTAGKAGKAEARITLEGAYRHGMSAGNSSMNLEWKSLRTGMKDIKKPRV